MPHPLDSAAIRDWCALALDALSRGREEIDAINVFPVADGDTGTNLHRTLAAAARALDDHPDGPPVSVLRAAARGALLGACGNSGTILAQLLRGAAEGLAAGLAGSGGESGEGEGEGRLLAEALRGAAESAYEAVARPVEGTMLTVARAAADSAGTAASQGGDAPSVARAAHEGAREALAATTGQLDVLREAGVVDAGGRGLVVVLGSLSEAVGGGPAPAARTAPADALQSPPAPATGTGGVEGPAYEVMYLLDTAAEDDTAARSLRARLGELGDSVVVGGGEGLWSVHVHTSDAGAAVEAGIAAGHPHRLRVTHIGPDPARPDCAPAPAAQPASAQPASAPTAAGAESPAPAPAPAAESEPAPHGRAIVAVVAGDGLAALCEEAGATAVRASASEASPGSGELLAAIRTTGAAEVVLLPNDPALHELAHRVAREARGVAALPRPRGGAQGVRVAVVPTESPVQGLAALAVHQPERGLTQNASAMTAAAGATRYGAVTLATREAATPAGPCLAGDVLGLIGGEVAVVGGDFASTAAEVLDRMLAKGGELVTLVLGARAPEGLARALGDHLRRAHPTLDTLHYEGGRHAPALLIGVE